MRWVALLLLLLNIGLFGYFKLTASQPVEMVLGHEAIAPEKLKILTAEEVAALPKKSSAPNIPAPPPAPLTPSQTSCYEWGSFAAAGLTRARNMLDQLSLPSELKQTAPGDATRYWVYVPPLPSPERAQAKNEEIRALGVQDSFVVQDPQWRNAISLGLFKDEALATKYLNDLHARGVRSAVKGMRNHEGGQSSFLIRNVDDHAAEALGKLQPDFPGSELKKVSCP
jgi:hypothetical protein